jgi:serine/threonine protein kinase
MVSDPAQPTSHLKRKVESCGNFPRIGSQFGDYFCLGRLGKGTFCSIHKCCALQYGRFPDDIRLVAAKVELSQFSNSGVLDGEASMLSYLDQSLPPNTVPRYLGHFVSTSEHGNSNAMIAMEFLEGDDMHQLREESGNRRLSVKDAVFFTADVLIPLLQRMHQFAGVVHRDVKPSNCVRRFEKNFRLVDFGLSKTIIVPKDSPYADRPFNQTHAFRKEREKADFRGTSMYASLRVHQQQDYSFRDDMWSVMYVFCDLVSGGLPWMSYAANRDRDACGDIKADIFQNRKASELLKGESYHLINYKRNKLQKEGITIGLPDIPEPLELSHDSSKIDSLQQAFDHLGSLGFTDTPDYDLLQSCIRSFLQGPTYDSGILKLKYQEVSRGFSPTPLDNSAEDSATPDWDFEDLKDPMNDRKLWREVQRQLDIEKSESQMHGNSQNQRIHNPTEFSCLPIEMQFRIAQMNYHSDHAEDTPPHVALRDFMKTAIPLVYGEWDSSKYEKGNHTSGRFRRDLYLKVVDMCLRCASRFQYFSNKSCYYDTEQDGTLKKRRILCTLGNNSMTAVSKIILGLRSAKAKESIKPTAPPAALTFSSGP